MRKKLQRLVVWLAWCVAFWSGGAAALQWEQPVLAAVLLGIAFILTVAGTITLLKDEGGEGD